MDTSNRAERRIWQQVKPVPSSWRLRFAPGIYEILEINLPDASHLLSLPRGGKGKCHACEEDQKESAHNPPFKNEVEDQALRAPISKLHASQTKVVIKGFDWMSGIRSAL